MERLRASASVGDINASGNKRGSSSSSSASPTNKSKTKTKKTTPSYAPTGNPIDDTMWSSEQFGDYLTDHRADLDYSNIFLQIKRLMWIAFHSVHRKVGSLRDNSFEIFGFDFMVDQFGYVWLIEVNTSPDLSFST